MNRIRIALLAVPLGLAACGGYTAPTDTGNMAPPTTAPNDIHIVVGASALTTAAFNPNPKLVSLGSNPSVTVRWVNNDISGGNYSTGTATIHNITSDNAAFTPSGTLGGNATYSVTLTATGDYHYHCQIHQTMVGTVTVTP